MCTSCVSVKVQRYKNISERPKNTSGTLVRHAYKLPENINDELQHKAIIFLVKNRKGDRLQEAFNLGFEGSCRIFEIDGSP